MSGRLLALLSAVIAANCTAAAGGTMLVVDASKSMWGQIDGVSKMAITREAITQAMREWPLDRVVGLTAYGHRHKTDCDDVEVLIKPRLLDPKAFNAKVEKLKPRGKTPMTAAVIHAAEALNFTEQPATVILVSDGRETCHPDPCTAAQTLEQNGRDLTVHVIGFNVRDQLGIEQLHCLAENTGGTFHAADSAASLQQGLKNIVAGNSPPVAENTAAPVNETVEPASEAIATDEETGAPPSPTASAEAASRTADEAQAAAPPAENTPNPSPSGNLTVTVLMTKDGPALEQLPITLTPANAVPDTPPERVLLLTSNSKGTASVELPVGDYIASVHVAGASASTPVDIAAGQTSDAQLILDVGQLNLSAVLSEHGEPIGGSVFTIFRRDDNSGEARWTKAAASDYAASTVMYLAPGDYLVRVNNGVTQKIQPIRIYPGKQSNHQFDLASARITLFATLKDNDTTRLPNSTLMLRKAAGESPLIQSESVDEISAVVPEGDWLLSASNGEASATRRLSVQPGDTLVEAVNLDAGRVKVTLLDSPGGQPFRDATFTVYRNTDDGDDKGQRIATRGKEKTVSFTLPAGAYTAIAETEGTRGETTFRILAGELISLEIIAR